MVGIHGVCMIVGYGILIQISELISSIASVRASSKTNYFQTNDNEKLFDGHRLYGSLGFVIALIGVITIFMGYGSETFDHGTHVIYGIIMISITIFQISLRLIFVNVDKIVHRWLGRFICFYAFWCIYTGQEEAANPSHGDGHDDHDHGSDENHSDTKWITYTLFGIFYFVRLIILGLRYKKRQEEEKDDVNQGEKVKESLELKTIDTNEIKQI